MGKYKKLNSDEYENPLIRHHLKQKDSDARSWLLTCLWEKKEIKNRKVFEALLYFSMMSAFLSSFYNK